MIHTVTAQKEISLENIWEDGTFAEKTIPGFNFMEDGRHFTLKKENKIVSYDITTGKEADVIFDPDIPEVKNGFSGTSYTYSFSTDEQLVLLAENRKKVYRRSFTADYYIYNRKSKEIIPLFDKGQQMNAHFSPDGKNVGFVYNNNLFYKNLDSGEIIQVTRDGKENSIINGAADWVYEEEFAITRTFEWSDNGNYIAYIRFDESEVEEFTMTNYKNGLYPEYEKFKYPKVGEKNAAVSLHLFDVQNKRSKRISINVEDNNFYIPRIKWTKAESELCVFLMNRHQNNLRLMLVDAQNSTTKLLMEENNPYYIDVHDNLKFLKGGKQFVWTSERDGFNQIYLYNMDGTVEKKLTPGTYDVTNVYGIDEGRNKVYFQAAKESPLQREIYSVDLSGGVVEPMEDRPGTNSAEFSTTFDYYILTYSKAGIPPSYAVFTNDGEEIRELENNSTLAGKIEEYHFQPMEFFTFHNREGTELNGYMIKPEGFDSTREYPLFMFLYGGPGSQQVTDSWGGRNYSWFQMLAQKGYVVACVDNRGTGARGQEFKKITYLQLGKYETSDQIDAARYLGNLHFIDRDRIGVFGWSYGGYMSTNLILHGNDVFSLAIAVAPVTNWRWYDTIYTERYMRTEDENEKGYHDYSPVYYADKLKGDYLLVHGLSDDNVHFQHSAEMAAALIRAGKDFETMYYPNNNHSINNKGARMHLYRLMTNFIQNKL